jgi:hypothetical protein
MLIFLVKDMNLVLLMLGFIYVVSSAPTLYRINNNNNNNSVPLFK